MSRQEHREAPVDCRSHAGITTGLIDSIITAAHVLATRDLTPDPVQQALADLRDDPDVAAITGPHVAPAPASPVPADVEVWTAAAHRAEALDRLISVDMPFTDEGTIATAQVHALLALSADPEPTLAPAAQPDLPSVMHEVHAAIDPDQVQKARVYYQTFPDGDLCRMRDYRLWEAAEAVAYVTALDERLAAGSDD